MHLPIKLQENLVGYWPLAEGDGATVYDYGSGQNNGVNNGCTSIKTTTGKRAKKLNGTSDYISLGDIIDFQEEESFTLSAWIKTTNKSNYQKIIQKGDQSATAVYLLDTSATSGVPRFGFFPNNIGTGNCIVTGSTDIADGIWHHIVGVRNTITDKGYLYVDSISDATPVEDTTTGDFTDFSGNDLRIGNITGSPPYYLAGKIGDAMIFNKALEPEEIKAIYKIQYRR